MLNDPLSGLIAGSLSLASGVMDLGDCVDKFSVGKNSSTNLSSMHEYKCLPQSSYENSWIYISCSEYQTHLAEMKKREGSLILIR